MPYKTPEELPSGKSIIPFGETSYKRKEVFIMKKYGNLRKDVNMANLDNLMLELRCDSDMLKAVHVAMAEGSRIKILGLHKNRINERASERVLFLL